MGVLVLVSQVLCSCLEPMCPKGRTGTYLLLPALHLRGRRLDRMTPKGESSDSLHLEGCISTGLCIHACTSPCPGYQAAPLWSEAPHVGMSRAGEIQVPTSPRHLPAAHPGLSWEGPRLPQQHACTHVQQGTHMLISGSPRCRRLGVGGLSTQSPGCCQNP